MSTEVFYSVSDGDPDDHGERLGPVVTCTVGRWGAAACAEHYWENHDGWESSWPLYFRLYEGEGEAYQDFKVEQDVEPTFYAAAVA